MVNPEIENNKTTDWLHIFTCGTIPQVKFVDGEWRVVDVEVKPERIKAIAENYDPEWRAACVMIGHRDYEQPALAWIAELKAEGIKMFAKLEKSTSEMMRIVAEELYRYVSIGTDFFERDGKEIDYLEHLALTNFPLVSGLQKLPEVYTGIAASKISTKHCLYSTKIDFDNFSKGMGLTASSKNLNSDNQMNEKLKLLATKIGISVNDYPTEDAVLMRASEIISELLAKFPDGEDQPTSLYMSIVQCGKLVSENTRLTSELSAAKDETSKATEKYHESLLASAVSTGAILEAEKDSYKELLKAAPEQTETILASKKPSGVFNASTVKNIPPKTSEEVKAGKENRSDWTYRDWETKDSDGLLKMMREDKEQFGKLFDAQYSGKGILQETKAP